MNKAVILWILATAIIPSNAMSKKRIIDGSDKTRYKSLLSQMAATPAAPITLPVPFHKATPFYPRLQQDDKKKSIINKPQKSDPEKDIAPTLTIALKKALHLIEDTEKRIKNLKVIIEEAEKCTHFIPVTAASRSQTVKALENELTTEQYFLDWLTGVGDSCKTISDTEIKTPLTNEEAKAFLYYLQKQKMKL